MKINEKEKKEERTIKIWRGVISSSSDCSTRKVATSRWKAPNRKSALA